VKYSASKMPGLSPILEYRTAKHTTMNYPVSSLFGSDEKAWCSFNCMNEVESLRGKPVLFMTGKAAFDLQMNRNLDSVLKAAGIAHLP
jgi:hypothetical protein